MSDPNATASPLVVATSDGGYYVIPMAALEQFKATAEQRAWIDAEAGEHMRGSFASPTAQEAAAKPSFASTNELRIIAWVQNHPPESPSR
jgi:hypothetical protein